MLCRISVGHYKDANLKRVANRNSVIDEIFFYTEL